MRSAPCSCCMRSCCALACARTCRQHTVHDVVLLSSDGSALAVLELAWNQQQAGCYLFLQSFLWHDEQCSLVQHAKQQALLCCTCLPRTQ